MIPLLVGSETPPSDHPAPPAADPKTSRGFEAVAFADDVLGIDLMAWPAGGSSCMLALQGPVRI